MYLKEIKSVGFKSFADKVSIEFKPGITGVVGPNGSGKSNIVDAVRWVLGEQSIKSLRGENGMVDVIFSGSKSRSSLNVASVTLIFDNADKYLPLDFTEIAVKRRVYRDGTNEYFLNGEQCRLKDITDLFVDTGSSKEAFNIISQGKIQEILSSKPEERRIIFEEAAGVLKYKKRKEEATRKIEKTHENLERINDIIDELELQVEPLRIQSDQAKKHLECKKNLENIEIGLITHDIESMNYDYQNTKNVIDELNKEIISLTTSSIEGEVSHEQEKIKLDKLDNDIYLKQGELVALTSKVEKLKGDKQLTLERSKYAAGDQKIHSNFLNLKEEKLKVNNELISLKEYLINCDREIASLNTEIEKINKNLKEVNDEKNNTVINFNQKLREESELKHRIELVSNSIENSGSLPSSVRQVLNNPRLRGIHDVIGKLIEVPEQYTSAIEIALGASSNFIIVDNELDAKDAIIFLKENKLGRATFFPINVIKPRGIDENTLNTIDKTLGFIGIASNLIKYDKQYRSIITNQLGNVIVVENIDIANNLAKQIESRYKIVTLDGEIIHVGGSVSGGRNQRENGIIKEKYELEQLLKNVNFIKNDCQILETKINDINLNIKTLEEELNYKHLKLLTSNELKNNKLILLNETNEKLNNIKKEIGDIEKVNSESISDVEEKIMEEYYKAEKEKQDLIIIIEDITKSRKNQNQMLEEMLAAMRQNNSIVNKKQNELKNLEINVNRMDVKLDNLLNILNEEYSLTFEKAKEKYILELDVDDARIQVNSLKADIRAIGTVNILAIEEYERVNKRYDFLNKQKNDLLNAQNTLLEIIKEMDDIMKIKFAETFKAIQIEFKKVFRHLFGGGEAELQLTDATNILETGIEMIVQPPGKKLQHLSLLSGGEKSLTAISLLFAILRIRPVPFCILDEVEAALDETNVQKFGEYLQQFKLTSQFIIITHKKKTMEYTDILYGVTMQESGVSKMVSVKLENIKDYAEQA